MQPGRLHNGTMVDVRMVGRRYLAHPNRLGCAVANFVAEHPILLAGRQVHYSVDYLPGGGFAGSVAARWQGLNRAFA